MKTELHDAHVLAREEFLYWEQDSQAPDPDEINERLRELDYDYRDEVFSELNF